MNERKYAGKKEKGECIGKQINIFIENRRISWCYVTFWRDRKSVPGRGKSTYKSIKGRITWKCKVFNKDNWSVGSVGQGVRDDGKLSQSINLSRNVRLGATLRHDYQRKVDLCVNWTERDSFCMGRLLAIKGKKLYFPSTHSILSRRHFWSPKVWSFSSHWPILQHQLASYNLTAFWHHLPGGSVRSRKLKGSAPQDCPLLQIPTARLDCDLCFGLMGYKLEVPTTSSSDLIIC